MVIRVDLDGPTDFTDRIGGRLFPHELGDVVERVVDSKEDVLRCRDGGAGDEDTFALVRCVGQGIGVDRLDNELGTKLDGFRNLLSFRDDKAVVDVGGGATSCAIHGLPNAVHDFHGEHIEAIGGNVGHQNLLQIVVVHKEAVHLIILHVERCFLIVAASL